MKRLLLSLLLTSCSGAIHAENDIFAVGHKNTDSNYTHGTKFTYIEDSNGSNEQTSYSISQTMYTPSQKRPTADPKVLNVDRPYAGWLSLERQHVEYAADDIKDTWGIAVGCVGECSLARKTQRQVHRFIGVYPPTWDRNYYLSNSEPGFILNADRSYLLTQSKNFDVASYIGGKAGTLIDSASLGLDFRYGHNLDKFSPEAVTFKLPRTAPNPWVAYLFGKLEDRIVGYNYFLDGSLFSDNSHTVTSEWNVRQADIGFVLGYEKFRFVYRLTFFSAEWQEKNRPVAFGGITLEW